MNVDDAHLEEDTMIGEASDPPIDMNPLGMFSNPPLIGYVFRSIFER